MRLTKKNLLKMKGDNKLIGFCIDYLIDYENDADIRESHLKDILEYGCASGTVSPLIYYKDTKEFYNTYTDEIDNIIDELEEMQGEPIKT
jgi:predicted transcriptional regulator